MRPLREYHLAGLTRRATRVGQDFVDAGNRAEVCTDSCVVIMAAMSAN